MRAKDQSTALLAGREVSFHRVGRSYARTVATVVLDGHDLGIELVRRGIAAWWPRGGPKPDWCSR
jgi:micrococcal nuclease